MTITSSARPKAKKYREPKTRADDKENSVAVVQKCYETIKFKRPLGNASMQSTILLPNVDYLRIDRATVTPQLKKYDPNQYFYLASYDADSFLNSDSMRDSLFHINTNQMNQAKQTLGCN